MRKDAVCEFMNVVMGSAVAKMERLGKRISIGVPKTPDISGKSFQV